MTSVYRHYGDIRQGDFNRPAESKNSAQILFVHIILHQSSTLNIDLQYLAK